MEDKVAEGEEKKKGFALFVYDFKQRKLIPIKFLSFILIAGYGVLFPFIPVHMKSLGITVQEMGMIYSASSLMTILARCTLGIIADKMGNFKILMTAMYALSVCTALLFILIPVGRIVHEYPANISLAIGCNDDVRNPSGLLLTDLDSKTCDAVSEKIVNVSLTLTECGYLCKNLNATGNLSDQKPEIIRKYQNAIFFPEGWTPKFSCLDGDCTIRRGNAENVTFYDVELEPSINNSFFIQQMMVDNLVLNKAHCEDFNYVAIENYLKVVYYNNTQTLNQVCQPQCIVQTKRLDLCANMAGEELFNPKLTFWAYLVMNNFLIFLMGGGFLLFTGASVAIAEKVKGDYSLQLLYGTMAVLIFSPISGALIDFFSTGDKTSDYRSAFYMYAGFVGVGSIVMLNVDLDFKLPAENLMTDLKSLLKDAELNVFIFVTYMSGVYTAFLSTYLFWFIEDLGGTKTLIGWTSTISGMFGIPILLVSHLIFRKIGHPNVQAFSLAVFGIRFIGYSCIYEPNMCLIYEVMECITNSLMYTSSIIYASQLSTIETLATVQGLVTAANFGLGLGTGSLLGGFLIKTFGTRVTFRIMGTSSFVLSILYFLFNIFYIRPKYQKKVIETKHNEEK